MQLKKQNKKTKQKKREIKNTNKIKEVKIMKK